MPTPEENERLQREQAENKNRDEEAAKKKDDEKKKDEKKKDEEKKKEPELSEEEKKKHLKNWTRNSVMPVRVVGNILQNTLDAVEKPVKNVLESIPIVGMLFSVVLDVAVTLVEHAVGAVLNLFGSILNIPFAMYDGIKAQFQSPAEPEKQEKSDEKEAEKTKEKEKTEEKEKSQEKENVKENVKENTKERENTAEKTNAVQNGAAPEKEEASKRPLYVTKGTKEFEELEKAANSPESKAALEKFNRDLEKMAAENQELRELLDKLRNPSAGKQAPEGPSANNKAQNGPDALDQEIAQLQKENQQYRDTLKNLREASNAPRTEQRDPLANDIARNAGSKNLSQDAVNVDKKGPEKAQSQPVNEIKGIIDPALPGTKGYMNMPTQDVYGNYPGMGINLRTLRDRTMEAQNLIDQASKANVAFDKMPPEEARKLADAVSTVALDKMIRAERQMRQNMASKEEGYSEEAANELKAGRFPLEENFRNSKNPEKFIRQWNASLRDASMEQLSKSGTLKSLDGNPRAVTKTAMECFKKGFQDAEKKVEAQEREKAKERQKEKEAAQNKKRSRTVNSRKSGMRMGGMA